MSDRETRGVLPPTDRDEKSGDLASEVLQGKHPDAEEVDPNTLYQHDELPEFVDVDIAETVVEKAAGELTGATGMGSTDGCLLKNLLLGFGRHSTNCRKAMSETAR